jgi:hypothetical protein
MVILTTWDTGNCTASLLSPLRGRIGAYWSTKSINGMSADSFAHTARLITASS